MAFKPERMKELREVFPSRKREEFRMLFPDDKKIDFSQQDLALLCNTTQQRISLYERGVTRPDANMLGKLADALKTSVDYLLDRTDNPGELAYSDLSEIERRSVDALRRGDVDADSFLLAQELAKLPNSIRDKLLAIARDLQKWFSDTDQRRHDEQILFR